MDVWGPHGPDVPDELAEKAIVAALPHEGYRRGFHALCREGSLTARLGQVCERLSAVDPNPRRVLAARRAVRDLSGVDVAVGDLREGWPPGHFDLIVLVDVLAQLVEADVTFALHTAALSTRTGATLIVAHTSGDRPDNVWTVAEVHARARADVRWEHVSSLEQDELTLDVLTRR